MKLEADLQRFHRTKLEFRLTQDSLGFSTKARVVRILRWTISTNHVFDLQPLTMILSPNSLFPREAGRSINKAIGFRLSKDLPDCPACELTARTALLPAASNTAAPPIFVRWLLSLPHYHGETTEGHGRQVRGLPVKSYFRTEPIVSEGSVCAVLVSLRKNDVVLQCSSTSQSRPNLSRTPEDVWLTCCSGQNRSKPYSSSRTPYWVT